MSEILIHCNTQAEVDAAGSRAGPIWGQAIVNWPKRRFELWYSGQLYKWITLRLLDVFPGDALVDKWGAYCRYNSEEALSRMDYVANYRGGRHDR